MKLGYPRSIVSASLGASGVLRSYKNAIDELTRVGVAVVVAAGNENRDACNYSPSYVASAITVGATTPSDDRASFSNYGRCVDIFAPGEDIASAMISSDTDSVAWSGTSMACPHVAGAVALIWSEYPGPRRRRVADVDQLLKDRATKGVLHGLKHGSPDFLLYTGTDVVAPALPSLVDDGNGQDLEGPLEVCRGDCDRDSHCKQGLACFLRDGATPVPGCLGQGTKGWDYCYEPVLNNAATNPPDATLGRCSGDCDKDEDCGIGLKCFQRLGYTSVPGCSGLGTKNSDYCYNPDDPKLPSLVSVDVNPKQGSGQLEACSGDCDNDSECKEGLACFQRDATTAVPGCSGQGKSGWDYCYKPVLNDVGVNPTSPKLGTCTGDCDEDSDCAKGLRCFQRDGFTSVPGCSGEGASDWDYCCNPNN